MRPKFRPQVTKQRSKTTLYLRWNLKSYAREAACGNGQPLSRYIESLLVGELAAASFAQAPSLASDSARSIRVSKSAATDLA